MITLVTGLWDIKRESLTEGWSRSFDHYKEKFAQLLKVENNMIIFGEPELESFVPTCEYKVVIAYLHDPHHLPIISRLLETSLKNTKSLKIKQWLLMSFKKRTRLIKLSMTQSSGTVKSLHKHGE
jgi:hypothetical protein